MFILLLIAVSFPCHERPSLTALAKPSGWEPWDAGLPSFAPVVSLAIDPGHPDTLYAGTYNLPGLWYSTDGGRTWAKDCQGPCNHPALTLLWDSGHQRWWAGTAGGLFFRPAASAIWQSVSEFDGPVFSLMLDEIGHIYVVAADRGLFRGEGDGSWTWQSILELDERAYTFTLAPDGALYVGLTGRVARSQDRGQTWSFSQGNSTGLHPQMPILDLVAVEQPGAGYKLYAGTRDGVYWSADQGRTWQRHLRGLGGVEVEALTRDGEGGILAATPSGLYQRVPGNDGWQPVAPAFRDKRFYALSSDAALRAIYAGMQNGLVQSTDGGKTWKEVASDLSPLGMPGVLVDPDNPDHVFIRLAFERVYESRDGGETRYHSPAQTLPAVHTLRADDELLRLASDMGFQAVVQVLSWEEIEPTPGEWHWEYPDFLTRAADFYDLGLIVRLDHPPEWALHGQGEGTAGHTSPFDMEAYLRFVEAVAQRYRGRVQGYIIWNEPNLAREFPSPTPGCYNKPILRSSRMIRWHG